MKANHAHSRNIISNSKPRSACQVAAVKRYPSGTSHCWARHTSVARVSPPITTTLQNIRSRSGTGAVWTRKRYRASAVVHARTMSARAVKNSENPKNRCAPPSTGMKQTGPRQCRISKDGIGVKCDPSCQRPTCNLALYSQKVSVEGIRNGRCLLRSQDK